MGRVRDLAHITARLFGTGLLVDSRKLDIVVPIILRALNGDDIGLDDVAPRDVDEPKLAGGIAIVPVIGTLLRRKSGLDAFSGLTSYFDIRRAMQCALDDDRVKAILLDIDTFGGEATGCFELCDWLYAQRGRKPIWAVADVDALSAGYAIASQADRCFVAPSGSTGSIGAVAVHCETSRLNEMTGVTYTVIRAGARKADLNQYEPLTQQALAKIQGSLDNMRSTFINKTSRARPGLSKGAAAATEGQWFEANDSVRLRLVDGIATLEDVLEQLAAAIPMPMNIPSVLPNLPAPVEDDDDDEPELQLPILPDGEDDEDDEDEDDDEGKLAAMPIPQPKKGESQEDYHSRCMGDDAMQEYDQDQRNAICYNTWRKDKDGKESSAMDPSVPGATAASTVVDIESARKQGAADAREIAELCTIFGKPQLAAEYLVSGKSLADVRKILIDMRASDDEKTGELLHHHPSPAELTVNSEKIWEDAFAKVWASSYPRAEAFRHR